MIHCTENPLTLQNRKLDSDHNDRHNGARGDILCCTVSGGTIIKSQSNAAFSVAISRFAFLFLKSRKNSDMLLHKKSVFLASILAASISAPLLVEAAPCTKGDEQSAQPTHTTPVVWTVVNPATTTPCSDKESTAKPVETTPCGDKPPKTVEPTYTPVSSAQPVVETTPCDDKPVSSVQPVVETTPGDQEEQTSTVHPVETTEPCDNDDVHPTETISATEPETTPPPDGGYGGDEEDDLDCDDDDHDDDDDDEGDYGNDEDDLDCDEDDDDEDDLDCDEDDTGYGQPSYGDNSNPAQSYAGAPTITDTAPTGTETAFVSETGTAEASPTGDDFGGDDKLGPESGASSSVQNAGQTVLYVVLSIVFFVLA